MIDDEITRKISDLNQLTETLYLQGKYNEALIAAQQSVELSRDTFGEDHPDYATSLSNLAGLYQSMGDYQKAEPFYMQDMEIRKNTLGLDHPDYSNSLNNLALLYQLMGEYQKAEQFYIQALEICKNALGIDHPNYATGLNNLALLYQLMGEYQKAEPLYIQAMEIRKKVLGIDHPDYSNSLNNLASLYQLMGEYQKAEPLYIQAMEIRKKVLGIDHPDYATGLNNLALLYQLMGEYQKAEPLYIQAMEIRKKVLGIDHPDYATGLNNLAALYQLKGAYQKAEPLFTKAMEIQEKILGKDHPDYATGLNNLAALYQLKGAYQKAEPLYIQAMEIQEKILGKDHPIYTTSLNNLAMLYQDIGKYQKAEPLYIQAMEIRKKVLGIDHPDYAASLNNLAMLYKEMGEYQKAEPFYIQALEICKNTHGIDHPHYSASLINLAGLHKNLGAYQKAEQFYIQAMQIQEKVYGINHPSYATSLNNLAALYKEIGHYQKAETFYMQALETWKNALGIDHPYYATSLNNLAGLYKDMEAYQEAESFCKQAMEIQEKVYGINHPSYAISLSILAGLYHSMGVYQKAELFYRQAMEIQEKVYGINHPSYATSLTNVAGLNSSMGSYDKAESLYIQAGKIWKRTLGKDHPNYGEYLQNLAILLAAQDRQKEAVAMLKDAALIEDRVIGEVFSISSEKQQLAYLSSVRFNFEAFVSIVSQHLAQFPNNASDALFLVLRRKAVTSEVLATQRNTILGGKYPHLSEKLNHLNTLRMQIARKTYAYPGKEGLEVHHQILAEWNNEKEHVEADLSRQIPEMTIEKSLKNANRTLIADSLPHESMLLEFFYYTEIDFKSISAKGEKRLKPKRYCAFVLPAGLPEDVKLIDLGEADRIDQLITAYKSKLTADGRASSEQEYPVQPGNKLSKNVTQMAGKKKSDEGKRSRDDKITISAQPCSDIGIKEGLELYSSLIAPLEAAIGNCRHLVIAPDSQLSLIPFEVIPTPDGVYLADQYSISYVGVGRDVLRFNAQIPGKPETALVMASPDFDLQAGGTNKISKSLSGDGRRSRDFSKSSEPYRLLKGAKLEGKNIGKLLGIKPLLGKDALEGRLKSSSSPFILHIATHGFFLQDQEMPANRTDLEFGMQGEMAAQRLSGAGIENPMLRSGLVLAGVNTWMKNGELPPEAEDGVLTAEDVTALDLTNTNLVVLSACETGLGDVKVGEGVFGLRRAFAIAGAKTLVMSLWKVPDTCTQELMEDFYRRILSGTPKAEALREAQMKIREKHPHPRDWGGFICQGDPGPVPMYKLPQ